MALTLFLALSGCKSDARKVNISTIYTGPKTVVREIPETHKIHRYTTHEEVTKRLDPMVVMVSKNDNTLAFRIQGNISSGGLRMNQIRKIRFEKGKRTGNTLTLKYYVEIKKRPGKESADVAGYNYTKDEICKIPDDVKIIKIELYEDQIGEPSGLHPKLIARQTFNFFAKI
ncbi:hypothetical protein DRF67_19975 [Chryseobacterium pennipullorum]|uniref:Uncharacterized protein n=1 Tax=Chryseobacterium pennipullorum TaxID=2258963 RepID=A0A3D9APF9_9FLAO|nr:hypothetical protein DRF67_19975 [Chryseobacterium pennipullorum]